MKDSVETESLTNPVDLVESRKRNRIFDRTLTMPNYWESSSLNTDIAIDTDNGTKALVHQSLS